MYTALDRGGIACRQRTRESCIFLWAEQHGEHLTGGTEGKEDCAGGVLHDGKRRRRTERTAVRCKSSLRMHRTCNNRGGDETCVLNTPAQRQTARSGRRKEKKERHPVIRDTSRSTAWEKRTRVEVERSRRCWVEPSKKNRNSPGHTPHRRAENKSCRCLRVFFFLLGKEPSSIPSLRLNNLAERRRRPSLSPYLIRLFGVVGHDKKSAVVSHFVDEGSLVGFDPRHPTIT